MKLHEISAVLDENKRLQFADTPQINEGEHQTTAITVQIPSNMTDFSYYFEFLCPDDKKYITPKLEVNNGKVEYEIENCVLKGQGYVYVQLVARSQTDNKVMFKSVKDVQSAFWVNEGINADIPAVFRDDFFARAQQKLDKVESSVNEIEEISSNLTETLEKLNGFDNMMDEVRQDLNNGKFKGERGVQGEKGERGAQGEKGDRGDGGVVVPARGAFSFAVENGDLKLYYADEMPQVKINSNGELLLDV